MPDNPTPADAAGSTAAGGPAGGGWDAMLAELEQTPPTGDGASDVAGDAAGAAVPVPVPVPADRMGQLVQLRAKVDALLVDQLRVFDAQGGAGLDGQTSTLAWTRARLRLGRDAPDLGGTRRC